MSGKRIVRLQKCTCQIELRIRQNDNTKKVEFVPPMHYSDINVLNQIMFELAKELKANTTFTPRQVRNYTQDDEILDKKFIPLYVDYDDGDPCGMYYRIVDKNKKFSLEYVYRRPSCGGSFDSDSIKFIICADNIISDTDVEFIMYMIAYTLYCMDKKYATITDPYTMFNIVMSDSYRPIEKLDYTDLVGYIYKVKTPVVDIEYLTNALTQIDFDP